MFTKDVFTNAAWVGNLEVMQWLRVHDCPWWEEDVCAAAAGGGHLEVLKWLRDVGCPWDVNTLEYAHDFGHAHVIEWARDNGAPLPDQEPLTPSPPESLRKR